MKRRFMTAVLISTVLISGGMMTTTLHAKAVASPDVTASFRKLASDYFEQVYFKFSPSVGTLDGLHQYDAMLEDYSRAAVEQQIAALKSFEVKFDGVSEAGLDQSTQGDLAMMRDSIRGTLLELETIRPWEKNPDTYSSGIPLE